MKDLAAVYRARGARYPDYWLLLITLILVVFGLVMVYSASVMVAVRVGLPENYYFLRELEFGAVGFVALVVIGAIDYRKLRPLTTPGYVVATLLLLLVLAPRIGIRVDGAQRWIALGPLGQLQPSELVKLAVALLLAKAFSERADAARGPRGMFLKFLLPTALPALLVMREPDLGTTCILVATAFAVYVAAGASLWLLPIVGSGLAAGFTLLVVIAPYRLGRIHVFQALFVDPWNQPALDKLQGQGNSYHIQQSVLALGSGGPFGLGLGYGRQRFGFLPAPHTDSIYAIIGEELGMVGCALVIVLFVMLAWRGFRIARQCPDRFGTLLATGLTVSLVVQAFINIGVVTDSIPFTGVPLPFISFGGSSLVVSLCAIGLLLSISRFSAEAAVASERAAERATARSKSVPHRRPAVVEPRRAEKKRPRFPVGLPVPAFAFSRRESSPRAPQAAKASPRRSIPLRSPSLKPKVEIP